MPGRGACALTIAPADAPPVPGSPCMSTLSGMDAMLTLSGDALTREVLEGFIARRVPEGVNVEYKAEMNDRQQQHILETIAAMANTYGGIILVGIAQDPNHRELPAPWPPAGVPDTDAARLVDRCYSKLQPPFAPEVIPVHIGNAGTVVVVVRVTTGRVPRPVVLDGKVLIRLSARNAPADIFRMRSLFAETTPDSATSSAARWGPRMGPHRPLDDLVLPHRLLRARLAIEAELPPDRRGQAITDERIRAAFREALTGSPLEVWLEDRIKASVREWDVAPWQPGGLTRSWVTTLRWHATSAERLPYVGQGVLTLPAGAHVAPRLTLLLDAWIWQPGQQDPPRHLLGLKEVHRLLTALLDTAIDRVAPRCFPLVLGAPIWETVGPIGYLDGVNIPLASLVRFPGRRLEGGADLESTTFEWPAHAGTGDSETRRAVVSDWLRRLMLDIGLSGIDDAIAALDAAS